MESKTIKLCTELLARVFSKSHYLLMSGGGLLHRGPLVTEPAPRGDPLGSVIVHLQELCEDSDLDWLLTSCCNLKS